MSLYGILLLILFVSIKKGTADLTYRKFVYQKDMSEYCRRRVIPAVFLGKQVVDANSQILHFSRLELPYSCFITVRTEMGSNIIVVIQVVADIDLEQSCKRGDHQLLIHEIGETFGGYWGQMPDSVMKPRRNRNDHTYTLRPSPTQPPTTTTERTTTTSPPLEPTVTRKDKDKPVQDDRYIRIEVPILNISANIVPGKMDMSLSFTTDDTFDQVNDVTPRAGVSYETTEVPLFEFGIKKSKGSIRYDNNSAEDDSLSQFQMELKNMFTPDPRLLLPDYVERTYKKKSYKYHPSVNKRLDFKKNKNLFVAKGPLYNKRPSFTNRRPQLNTVQPNNYVSKLHGVRHPSTVTSEKTEGKSNYWDAIHDILKNLSQSSDFSTQPPHKELANFLRGGSNKKFNKSAYLSPDLSYIDVNAPLEAVTEPISITTEGELTEYSSTRTYFHELNDATRSTTVSQDFNKSNIRINNTVSPINNDNGATVALLPLALDVDSIILNVTNQNKNDALYIQDKSSNVKLESSTGTNSSSKLNPLAGSLVDHESFENVVQSASAMAIKLNQTKVTDDYNVKQEVNVRRLRRSRKRKKRYLHAIEIEGAQPHQIHIMKHVTTTAEPEKFNKRQFQRLIELQDDEISDRVAMRYLPQFMGQPVLDFCDLNGTSTKYVFLFNSSRLVLALSNFSMKRMTVVLTPSRTLRNSELRCGPSHLECQISGARVCIDALSACDGVPNCGSYDIYDEDRLTCGAASGFRHNVCLAAITFLAVLLTVLYTIHYWLKRCVPRVSDAFFIYTDAAENVLYLDTIMKSPHDIGVSKDFFRGVQDFLEFENKVTKQTVYRKFINKCLMFLRCRHKKPLEEVVPADFDQFCSQRLSAFAEMEIQNMTRCVVSLEDTAVQTGSSLHEVLGISPISSNDIKFASKNYVTFSMERVDLEQVDSDSTQPSDELNMLQFLRKVRARSISLQQSVRDDDFYELSNKPGGSSINPPTTEKEIRSEIYEPDDYNFGEVDEMKQPQTSKKKMTSNKNEKSAIKHLRFQDEGLVMSPKEVDDDTVERNMNPRRSIIFGANKVFHIQEPEEAPNEAEELTPGGGRELKSYFNWGKEKKKKKPKKK